MRAHKEKMSRKITTTRQSRHHRFCELFPILMFPPPNTAMQYPEIWRKTFWLVWILPQECYEKLYKHNENTTGNVILVPLPQQKLMDNSLGLTCSLTSSFWTVRSNFSIIFKIDFISSSYSKRFKDCSGVFAVRKFSSSKTHSFVRGKSSHFKTPMKIIPWIYKPRFEWLREFGFRRFSGMEAWIHLCLIHLSVTKSN